MQSPKRKGVRYETALLDRQSIRLVANPSQCAGFDAPLVPNRLKPLRERESLVNDTVTNSDRSEWARVAVFEFARETRMDTAGEEDSTILQDLLADLRHWCDQETINYDEVSEMARLNYEEEVKEETEAVVE